MNSPGFEMPQGAWARGNLLIASHAAVLPPFCVQCGRPSEPNRLQKTFSWQPRWVYLFLLIAFFIYVILALVMRRQMTMQVPLCTKHREKYRTLRITAAVLGLGAILEMVLAVAYLPKSYAVLGVVASLCALLAGAICLSFSGVLGVNFIDDSFGYFSNASESFLAQLPPIPPGMMLPR